MEKNTNTGLRRHYVLPGDTITEAGPDTVSPGIRDLQQKAEVHHA